MPPRARPGRGRTRRTRRVTAGSARPLAVGDTAPTLTITAPGGATVPQGGSQLFAHLSFPQADTIATGDAEGDPVTTTASASAFSLPFSLEQQYRFTAVGYQTAGAKAFVLQAPQANAFGNAYYL